MVKKLLNKVNKLDNHTLEVVKKSFSAIIVKLIGVFSGVFLSVFLGRVLGTEGLGIINLSNRIVTILIIISMLGVRQLLVKEIAIAYSNKNWKSIGDHMYSAYWLNGLTVIILAAVFIFLTPFLSENIFKDSTLSMPLMIALTAMVFQVFSRIFSSGLIGYRKVWQSNLVDRTLSVVITGLILAVMWIIDNNITVLQAALAYGLGRFFVMLTVYLYWQKIYPHRLKRTNQAKQLFKAGLPFLLVSGMGVLSANVDSIMIGWLSTVKNVGLYTVAAQIALLTSFFLQVTNSALSPKLAALYAEKKIEEMNIMVQKVTLGLWFVALFPLVFFLFFGETILSLWGEDFTEAYWVLIILSIGQLFNIGTGAAGLLLVMCGFEKSQAYISITSIIFNIILNYLMINEYGALGAAIATSVTVAVTNIMKVIVAKIKIGVMTLPFLGNL